MNNDLGYAMAMHPDRLTVGGVLLLPFCVGHALLLTRMRSPLSGIWSDVEQPETRIGIGDMAQAIWVMERPASEAFQRIGSWSAQRRIKHHGKRLSKMEPEEMAEVWNQLGIHIRAGFVGPKLRPQSGGGGKCGTPMLAMLKAGLVHHFHKSEAEALNTPITTALWDRAALLEEKGLIQLWNKEDEEFMEWARKLAEDPELMRSMFEKEEALDGQ